MDRISFCTTCMNRLHHLRETLPKNLWDNKDYFNLEFILLDYNSTDGLEDYVKSELAEFIESGRLVFYRTEDPILYNMSHSRNLAFKLASGNIVCNIDADNFTGKGFASFVNTEFDRNTNIFLSTHNNIKVKNDVLGRLCVKKEHFLDVGGYDERMKYYGFDDYDLVNRLEIYGIRKQIIDSKEFLHAIIHSNEERMNNGLNDKGLERLLIRYLSPAQSQLFFLFENDVVYMGTMINNNVYDAIFSHGRDKKNYKYNFSIAENAWEYGVWENDNDTICLKTISHELLLHRKNEDETSLFFSDDISYHEIANKRLREEALFFFHQISNRIIMEQNLLQKKYRVNEQGYGKAKVVQGFNNAHPIYL